MTSFHIHQIAKLTAEIEAGHRGVMEVEAAGWAITRHKAALAKIGVFAI